MNLKFWEQDKNQPAWRTVVHLLLAAVGLVYTLSRFLPTPLPPSSGALDRSWLGAAHYFFVQRFDFGKDVIANYGPWGILVGGYHPATFGVVVLTWSLLALVFWWSLQSLG